MEPRATLASLLSGIDARCTGDADIEITGIAYDSRHVAPGDVFVAVPGFVHDGLRFVADAVAAGAVAVIAQDGPEAAALPSPPAAWARVADARRILAPVAARFYGDPSEQLTVIGITGTNGKTTTTALLDRILATRGPTGRWSTTTVSVAGSSRPAHRTTPEGPDLQAALREMVDAGCWAAAIEVSSHALALHRVDGTRFVAGVFTNLSGDHLDFHKDMDEYLDAKAMLFERLEPDGIAVLNVGDPVAAELAARTRARVVGYGWLERPGHKTYLDASTYWIRDWAYLDNGSRLRLATPGRELELETPLFGPANALNLAAAVATAMELGLSDEQIIAPVAAFQGARGRFQRVNEGQPFAVLVDFAHTPAALQAALAAARALAGDRQVIVVFGAGGDRDRGKRPAMGRIAAEAADQVLVTSDNPRSEDPEAIIDEIVAGMPSGATAQIKRAVDRRRAIEHALERARPGDCVLIAGKGHEREQIFADRTIPFDDVAVATEWLRERYPRRADGSLQTPAPAGGDNGRTR
ncbi:MAG: UDP-N-acetylmuramoyl-L-alanyl-D-glutamate--2,6-diaminopimelate ligase [Acidobacteriota bacterium]|jgi:UDP-N-acetylmuramoyl-L-alanyl-D-glutamate--2,6-diaminopimelate ligase